MPAILTRGGGVLGAGALPPTLVAVDPSVRRVSMTVWPDRGLDRRPLMRGKPCVP
jgi:hypothetical protein